MKKNLAVFLTILLIFISATAVFAVDKMDLTLSESELNVGEELTLTINFDSESTSSLSNYTAKLKYDKDVFETVEKEDFGEQENWSDIKYSNYDSKFSLTSESEETTPNHINIKLKVKEDAKPGETNISVYSASASDGENTLILEDASQKVKILGEETDTVANIENENTSNIQTENQEAKGEFPWLALICVLLCIAIIFGIVKILPKFNPNKKEKTIITLIGIILVILLLTVSIEKAFRKSANVNTDTAVGYEETVKKDLEYILEIKNKSEELINSDIDDTETNNDNTSSTNETSSETEKNNYVASSQNGNSANSNINYTSNNNDTTDNSKDNDNDNNNNDDSQNNDNNVNDDNPNNEGETPSEKYDFTSKNMTLSEKVSKDDKLILSFENAAQSQYGVKSVVINGIEYQVKNENGKYTVELPKGIKGSKNKVTVEKAILENGYEKEINQTFEYTYLKDKPSIESIDVEKNDKDLTVDLAIKDTDLAVKDVTIYLIDEKGNVVTSQKLSENGNLFDISKAGTYKVKSKVTYDLGDNNELSIEKEAKNTYNTPLTIKIIDGKILSNGKDTKYLKQGQNAQVVYTFESNTDEVIKEIYLNSQKLSATKNADGTYVVSFDAPKTAGKLNLEVSKVHFDRFGDIDVTYSQEVEILKSVKPNLSSVQIDKTGEKPVLVYEIKDQEDTFVSGKIVITNIKNPQEKQEVDIQELKGNIELENIKPFTRYSANFVITYDLDENKENNDNQEVRTFDGIEFELEIDYEFELKDLKVTNVDRTNKKISLQFTSTNVTETNEEYENHYVTKVTINGKVYNVTKSGNSYTVTIPYENETNTVLELQTAELNNGHQFKNLENKVVVFKTKPTAKVDAEVIAEQKTIKGKIDITDADNIITALEARLVDSKGKTISSQQITKETKEVTFDAGNDMFNAGIYSIEIGADYDAVDGLVHNSKETIGKADVTIHTKASITKAEVQNYYIEKGKNVEIKYTYKSNNKNKPTGINIDDTFYPATVNLDDGTFTVSILAGTDGYGVKTIDVKILMFDGETVVLDSTKTAEYYLLKTTPSIEKYTFNEFVKNQSLEFSFKNPENAIIKDAKVILTNEENEEVLKETLNTNIEKGKDTAETKIELNKDKLPNGTYTLSLSGTYDLDDEENNEKNTHNLSEIFEQKQIQVITTYTADLSITKVDVKKDKAIVTFTSTNSVNVDVKYVIVDGQKYEVTKQDDENTYTVEILHKNEEYTTKNIQKVIVSRNGTDEIDIDLANVQSYELFKKAPKATNVTTKYEDNKLSVEFNLEDEANIAKNVTVVVKNGDTVVASQKLENLENNKGKAEFENITKAGKYTVEVLADYERNDGNTHNQVKINDGNTTYEVAIKSIVTFEKLENKYFDRNTKNIDLAYTITSNTDKPITAIVFNGKEYTGEDLKVENGKYVFTVDIPQTPGEKVYELASIKYEDTEIKVNNKEACIYVLKLAPQVTDFTLNTEEKSVSFKVDNPEEAIIKGKVVINLNGEAVYTLNSLEAGDIKINLSDIPDFDEYATYDVTLDGTYDLDNEEDNGLNEHQLSELFKKEIQLKIGTDITFENFSTRYPEKSNQDGTDRKDGKEFVEITFKINSNTSIPVSEIYVNDKSYPATLVGEVTSLGDGKYEGKYTIKYKAKDTSGIETLTVKKVKYDVEDVTVQQERTEKIDVLKSAPYVPFNYEIDENYKEKTITFKFELIDPENIIVKDSAYVTLGAGNFVDTNGKARAPIKVGKNEVTFVNVVEQRGLPLDVCATYDLDTNELTSITENDNYYKDKSLFKGIAWLFPPSVVKVENISAQKSTGEVNKYLNKNETFHLSFTSETFIGSLDGQKISYYPEYAQIGGKSYKLIKDGNTYTTEETLEGYADAGVKDIVIENITLSNKEVIEEDVTGTLEVLKDRLTVENFKVDISSGKAVASYDLKDSDNSFVTGVIKMKDTDNNKVSTLEINKAKNSYELTLNPYIKYSITLEITSDLDEDHNNKLNQEDQSYGPVEVEIIPEYNLKISNAKVTQVNNAEHKATIEFTATNNSRYKVKSININGTDYVVTPLEPATENRYAFEYPYGEAQEGKRTEIKIDNAILDNEKNVEPIENNSVVIFKNKPEVTSISTEIVNAINIHTTFDVEDTDKTLSKLYVALKDNSGAELKSNDIELQDINDLKGLETTFEGINAGKYTVEILADYDTVDGAEHIRTTLKQSEEINITPVIDIKTNTKPNKYLEKGAKINLDYEITSNTGSDVNKVMINETEYPVKKIREGIYRVEEYTVPTDAGLYSIKLQRVDFENGMQETLETPHTDEVDILRAIPSIDGLSEIDDVSTGTVIFNFNINDPDNTIISGTATVGSETLNVDAKTTTLSFKVSEVESQKLRIDIIYDLDSDKNDAENTDTLVLEKEFTLISNYELTITDAKTYNSKQEETKFFNKNEKIQLRFKSENKANLPIKLVKINDLNDDTSEGENYDVTAVTKSDGTINYYYITINGKSEAGKEEIEILGATLDSGKTIARNEFKTAPENISLDILKTTPEITDIKTSNKESDFTVSFEVTDPDNALLNSYVRIVSSTGTEVLKELIHNGTNSHTVTLEPGVAYTLTIERNYNLDSEDEDDYNTFKETLITQTVEIAKKEEVNFKMRNLTIPRRIKNGGTAKMTFENELMTYQDVEKIVIDGEEPREVTEEGDGVYSIILKPKTVGVNTINIDSVILGGKTFIVDRPVSYIHEYIEPTVTEYSEIEENKDNNTATINYKIADPDKTLRSLTAYMTNSSGELAGTTPIEDLSATSLSMPLIKSLMYRIELKATYDIGDGKTLNTKSLFVQKKETEGSVSLLEEKIDKEFVEKGGTVTLQYKIYTNMDQEVKKIYLEGTSYNVEKVKDEKGKILDDTYQIVVEAPTESGVYRPKVSSMQVGGKAYSVDDKNPVKIKVLKDVPSLSHFILDENSGKLSFKLNDKDHALTEAPKFKISDGNQEIVAKALNVNKEDYTYEIKDLGLNLNTQYNVLVNASYDLDPEVKQENNIMNKLLSLITAEEPPQEEPEFETAKVEDIYKRDIKLIGAADYEFEFDEPWGYYMWCVNAVRDDLTMSFKLDNKFGYKSTKIIIDGEEFPVGYDEKAKYPYYVSYPAKSYDQSTFTINKIILENGAVYELNRTIACITSPVYPKFYLTEVQEDINTGKGRIYFRVTDKDDAIENGELTFVIKNSQNQHLQTVKANKNTNYAEFDIPNPPTATYKIDVSANVFLFTGFAHEEQLYSGTYDSIINTSILRSEFETRYPKKGETISVDYIISSTKVVLVDPNDHANLSKAINITSLVINGKEYSVEHISGERYRIYYTAGNTAKVEELKVSQINFSNNTSEIFEKIDKIEVLKDVPKITEYKTENNIEDGKVTFSFNVEDPDSVVTTGSLKATVGDQTQQVIVGVNKLEFPVEKDQLLTFAITGSFDLDTDQLNSETEDQNIYSDTPIFTKKFMLTGSYDVKFDNVKTFNTKGEETQYFEKNENVKVGFEFTAREGFYPDDITVNGEAYIPEIDSDNDQLYYITIKGSNVAGKVNANINSITLNSGNTVKLDNQNISYEVLKDIVKIDSFEYQVKDNDANTIKLAINISDNDSSSETVQISVKDEYGTERKLDKSILDIGDNEVSFAKTVAAKYFVTISSNYDRDTIKGGENHYDNTRVYFEVVTINTRYIEMKDIVDVQLYRHGKTGVERVYSLTEDNLKVLENCIVKVTMRDVSPFFSEIKEYSKTTDGKLKLVLAYDDAKIYTDKALKPLEVTLDVLSDNSYEYRGSFKSLVDQINADPKGTFKLEKDYDLSDYPGNLDNSNAIIANFEGKLEGNGHIISNLHKPLFRTTNNSEIKDLIIKGVTFTNSSQGATIVHTASNTTISNVHIDNISHVNGSTGDENSAFAYKLEKESVLKNSSAININFTPGYLGQVNAGAVSYLYGSTIENCYVQGRITSGWHFNGGLVGKSNNSSKIKNNIINVQLTPYYNLNEYGGNGGIVSSADGVLLENNLSLMDSNTKAAAMYNPNSNISKNSTNNYQLEETNSTKQSDVNSVKKADINKEFLEKTMYFDTSIWNIDSNTSFENLPTLKGKTLAFSDNGTKPNNSNVYIPDYSRISNMEEYRSDREIIYHNMFKLMPFYDAKEILTDGNKLDTSSIFNKKLIKYVLPYNKEGKLVSSLTTKNYNSLGKISIVFEDGEEKEYKIDYDDYYGNVVSYIIEELNIGYNYNKFVLHEDSEIIEKLVTEASSYTYTRDLEPLTGFEDYRVYQEFFDSYTKNHIREFVEDVVTNSGYIPTFKNDVFDNLAVQNLIDTGKLKQMLYAYNYFKYWYRLDMDGVEVADAIMFHGDEMFDDRMTLENITVDLLRGNNAASNGTGNFFNNYLAPYTRLTNLGHFLDYLVTSLTDKSGNEWFRSNWKGGIYFDVSINQADTYYSLWDHLKRSGNIQNSFLPLFTVPNNSMYVITCPTQVFYGSLRIYMKNPDDPAQLNKFINNDIAKFNRHIKNFYTFAHTYVGAAYLNPFVDVEYDVRTTYTGTGEATVFNNAWTTTEPYHKYFAEAMNKWPASNGTGAYATGSEVYWNVIKLINGFNVSSHESLHNQDSKVFLKGYGRRGKDGNSEDYTAGNLQQYFNDGWVSPNIMEEDLKKAGIKNSITQNYKLERVNTNAKLKDFYDKYFRLNDMLDYIEAQAFLTLSEDEQVALATQVSYPRLANQPKEVQLKGDSNVAYEPLTKEKRKNMTLNTVSDLWDNQIMLRPGNRQYDRRSPGADTDSLYNIHWYQPHADDDRPDGGSFKWLAWEMAATGGYYDGYMAYYSKYYIGATKLNNPTLATTDLLALQTITGKNSFKEYKQDRYEYSKAHYKDTDTYIDVDKIYQEYLSALKEDAKDSKRQLSNSTAVKRKYFIGIKEATNDFEVDPFTTNKAKAKTNTINTEKLENVVSKKSTNINVQSKTSTKKDIKDVKKEEKVENTTTNEISNATNNTSSTNTAVANIVDSKKEDIAVNNTEITQ